MKKNNKDFLKQKKYQIGSEKVVKKYSSIKINFCLRNTAQIFLCKFQFTNLWSTQPPSGLHSHTQAGMKLPLLGDGDDALGSRACICCCSMQYGKEKKEKVDGRFLGYM